MDIQNRIDAQIFSDRLLNNRKLFLTTYCISLCQIPKSQTTYEQGVPQLKKEEKLCIGGCLRKVNQAFKYLVHLDSINQFHFEKNHSIEQIQTRLDRPNLDYGNYEYL